MTSTERITATSKSRFDASAPVHAAHTAVNPVEFLRAALKISAEDAAKVREDAAEKMKDGAADKD